MASKTVKIPAKSQVSKGTLPADAKSRAVQTYTQQGNAAAALVVNVVKDSLNSSIKALQEIAKLSTDARGAFRAALDNHIGSIREQVKRLRGGKSEKDFLASNPKPEEIEQANTMARAMAVWNTRISEFRKFSEALDAGFTPDLKLGYAKVLGNSRMFLESNASTDDGSGATRGRARKDARLKLQDFLEGQIEDAKASDEEKTFCAKMLETVKAEIAESLKIETVEVTI